MTVFAFESSCDECSAAVIRDGRVSSVVTHTQTVHQAFGGVVPELAGRSHLQLIDGIANDALDQAGIDLQDVDVIASTTGPGLVGSLLVGMRYGQGISQGTGKPFRSIHHMEAHLFSAEIEEGETPLPFVVLLVSGGHTLLVLVKRLRRYELLGTTLDDALGEAYDKVGKLVGLPFPAGAEIDRLASTGNPRAFDFPVPKRDSSLDFSFSGLKTAFRYRMQDMTPQEIDTHRADLLASFQAAALRSTADKVALAVERVTPRALVVAGGVAANSELRKLLHSVADRAGIPCRIPPVKYCGDNAAMVGYAAHKLESAGIIDSLETVVRPRWSLESLCTEASSA